VNQQKGRSIDPKHSTSESNGSSEIMAQVPVNGIIAELILARSKSPGTGPSRRYGQCPFKFVDSVVKFDVWVRGKRLSVVLRSLLLAAFFFPSVARVEPGNKELKYRRWLRWRAVSYSEIADCGESWVYGYIRLRHSRFSLADDFTS
jgi:hypothetical protein